MKLLGGLTVLMEMDRDVSYSEVEHALKAEGLPSDSYLINRQTLGNSTQLTISIHVPVSAITEAGVPPLYAGETLKLMAAAISRVEAAEQ